MYIHTSNARWRKNPGIGSRVGKYLGSRQLIAHWEIGRPKNRWIIPSRDRDMSFLYEFLYAFFSISFFIRVFFSKFSKYMRLFKKFLRPKLMDLSKFIFCLILITIFILISKYYLNQQNQFYKIKLSRPVYYTYILY